MNQHAGPVGSEERIGGLDTLRGFALLGILVMNIQSFSMPGLTYINPTMYGDFTGVNYFIWLLSHIFFDMKMMNLFSLMFGAGIILLTDRCEAKGQSSFWIHYRRMGILFGVGMIHAYAFWYGDILVTYALCGLVVYWFRKLGPGWLVAIGLAMLSVCSGMQLWNGMNAPTLPADEYEMWIKYGWTSSPTMLEWEISALRGSWIEQMPARAFLAFYFQVIWNLLEGGIFRPLGMMLLGMALYRIGFFEAHWIMPKYIRLSTILLVPGFLLIIYGVMDNHEAGWTALNYYTDGLQYNYWGAVLVSVGYAAGLMAAVACGCLSKIRWLLGKVGQMAFTNYLTQTLICTTIFYGHGLGWFGNVDRITMIGVVAFVWILQLIWSPLWLGRFRFGPLEWAWRCLTYGKMFPITRREPQSPS